MTKIKAKTKLTESLLIIGIVAWAVVPLATMLAGWIGAEPYVFALGAVLLIWQAIDHAADRIVKATHRGTREVVLTIERPFREKLNDALGMARIRPTGKRDQ